MKRLLVILILTLSFQSLTKADDIRDFEIEGMSVGDSLLDHFSRDEILKQIESNKTMYTYLTDKFGHVNKFDGLSKYHLLSFYVKKRDKNFIIHSITGSMDHVDNIEICHQQMKSISKEFSNIFKKAKKKTFNYNHAVDKSGRSKVREIRFELKSKDKVRIVCMDFEETLRIESNWIDGLDITVQTNEVTKWFQDR